MKKALIVAVVVLVSVVVVFAQVDQWHDGESFTIAWDPGEGAEQYRVFTRSGETIEELGVTDAPPYQVNISRGSYYVGVRSEYTEPEDGQLVWSETAWSDDEASQIDYPTFGIRNLQPPGCTRNIRVVTE